MATVGCDRQCGLPPQSAAASLATTGFDQVTPSSLVDRSACMFSAAMPPSKPSQTRYSLPARSTPSDGSVLLACSKASGWSWSTSDRSLAPTLALASATVLPPTTGTPTLYAA